MPKSIASTNRTIINIDLSVFNYDYTINVRTEYKTSTSQSFTTSWDLYMHTYPSTVRLGTLDQHLLLLLQLLDNTNIDL